MMEPTGIWARVKNGCVFIRYPFAALIIREFNDKKNGNLAFKAFPGALIPESVGRPPPVFGMLLG